MEKQGTSSQEPEESITPDPELVEAYKTRIENTPPDILASQLAAEQQRRDAKEAALEETSRIDARTGLANSKAYEEEITRAIEVAIDDGQPISLMVIDIDNFSEVNNDHGGKHQAGNEVLTNIAGTLMSNVKRGSDRVFRYGGDELVVLVPQGQDIAVGIAKRLRGAVEQSETHFGTESIKVTVSIGVSSFVPGEYTELASIETGPDANHERNKSIVDQVVNNARTEVFLQADTATYAAKDAGRNTVAFKDRGSNSISVFKKDPQNPQLERIISIPYTPQAKSG